MIAAWLREAATSSMALGGCDARKSAFLPRRVRQGADVRSGMAEEQGEEETAHFQG